jgi:alpha-mannosidase
MYMKKVRLLLLTACMALGIGVTAQAQNWGRNATPAVPEYPQKDSLEREGYKLVFYSNATDFSPTVKTALVQTFFAVYPTLVERFNIDAQKRVVFAVDTAYHDVAAAFNGRIIFNPDWFRRNPNDLDVVTHEVMHLVQNYGRSRVPGWVAEGIADYARYRYGLHNREAGWTLTELQPNHHYTSSYRITARFFAWLEERRDPQIVDKLDQAAREDRFYDNIWEELTGRTIDQLWDDYRRMPGLLAQAQGKPKLYAVSNAHFDSQWNWDVQTSIRDYVSKTLDQNLFLLKQYPDYIFNFEGGIKYAWMKEYYPDQYEEVKKYVRQNRWHVTGSTWDAADANIPSPESFTRNILYGQQFFQDEFGVRSTDIFLPDCFGFGWTLPTVAAHAGLIGFSTQKLQWRSKPFYGNSKIPFEIGLWQGIDGARIMLVADAHNYTTRWRDEDISRDENLLRMTEANPGKVVYHYYGTGDTGGAPTIESVRAVEKGLAGDGPLQVISATSDRLYKDYLPFDSHPELPVHNGELLMDVHGTGCYTSEAAMKLYNRKNERLADAAERTAVVADWLGGQPYPGKTLAEAWRRFIWHQFHDDLTGTSIPRAYEFSWNDELIAQKQFAQVWASSAGSVSRALNTQVGGMPLVIQNPVARQVNEVIEITVDNLAASSANFRIYDTNNRVAPAQLISQKDGKAKLLVAASLPAASFSVYDLRTGKAGGASSLKVSERTLENAIYKLTLNDNGDITSILDKRYGKELVRDGKTIRLALITPNESFSWPAWEIMKNAIDRTPENISGNVRISIVEKGPLRASLCVEKTHGESVFRQYIRLTDGGQDDRIDFVNEIDWQSASALLKAEFPLNVANESATYDLGAGSIQRKNNTETAYEVYAQYWADLTDRDGSYGVSIMNDSKYGWDKPDDHTLRLTLLHTPGVNRGYTYQNRQDFGFHTFTYSLAGHQGSHVDAQTADKAEALNQQPKVFVASKHTGMLGRQFSFVSVDNDHILVKALKKAEKTDDFVIRVYETAGKKVDRFNLSFAGEILEAKELNGVEDSIGTASFENRTLTSSITPFSIRTYSVKLKRPATPSNAPRSLPVELKYNIKTATYNAFRTDANVDGKGYSYAAELLPDTLMSDGIAFALGDPASPNAMTCRGDTILLPQDGSYNRLYLLAASTYKDQAATFLIDGKPVELQIPNYSGFIGQWRHTEHTEGFLKPSEIAFVGTHKHSTFEQKDVPYEFTYLFRYVIDIPKTASRLILADNPRVLLFAATLVQSENEIIRPATELLSTSLKPEDLAFNIIARKNLLKGKTVTAMSGEGGNNRFGGKAASAIDNDFNTRWTDFNSESEVKFLEFDLGKDEALQGWFVYHGGTGAGRGNMMNFIAKDYRLEVKLLPDAPWQAVDEVTSNDEAETDRLLSKPVTARYIRLSITRTGMNNNAAQIAEFEVY